MTKSLNQHQFTHFTRERERLCESKIARDYVRERDSDIHRHSNRHVVVIKRKLDRDRESERDRNTVTGTNKPTSHQTLERPLFWTP